MYFFLLLMQLGFSKRWLSYRLRYTCYDTVWCGKKTRTVWLHDGEKSLMMCLAVLIEYWRVTDRRTDRQTDILRQH